MTAPSAPLRLIMRVDADHGLGLGHAVRCAGLAEELAGRAEGRLALTVVGAGAVLASLFPGAALMAIAGDDDRAFGQALARVRPNGVVIDHPRHNGRWSQLVRRAAAGTLVAVIDDWGGEIDADVIINGTVLDDYHHYTGMPDGALVLTGPRYTLLRSAFAATPWPSAAGGGGVVMVVGSGARAGAWAFFLTSNALDRSGWGPVRMVVGGAFPERAALTGACAAAGIALSVGLTAPELASVLASSSLALITGGMIVYEALAVGVPAVVFPQLDDLIPEARWLAERGCVLDLGFEGGFDGPTVAAAVARLLGDDGAALALSHRGRTLLDGRGTERAAAALAARLFL